LLDSIIESHLLNLDSSVGKGKGRRDFELAFPILALEPEGT